MSALIILSGGMDSVTCLHHHKQAGITHALNFDYGSKHNAMEQEKARVNCDKLGIDFKIISLDFIGKYFKSDLLKSGDDVPEGHYAEESMKRTVVPFRNAIMLSIATGYAESLKLDRVYIANHAGDHTIYPDCRLDFVKAFGDSMKLGTWAGVSLIAPYTLLTKRQIAEIGKQIGVDYAETYTCYRGGLKHCGKCGSCTERKEALFGFDPTQYEA